ncbi:MAG: zf-HC2 domain-containing protein [Sphaerochaeta sp.]|uniref:anti-sigma factor family protein n=1 Tax=Sphaerochaeta sp. S2 TaxID=2798868 RepID=UPI0018E94AFF|nr:zf-HC2 domain-containing protein [Sphaerochaeta sp. S2]MCK9347668.1 zf-HC2 domain-containing protein [Sphaerochaeta sp.]MBJ2355747.1 zf-HC2 domain-containing protein [Sphaerochaeta sp. S2]MDD4301300.1 zf-HC2 domain-containing protein [Sphaerochaeta sp.]MDD4647427.1 zf-HC2 domain-containing protein [Sphaerochaeta sp.]MDY0244062.1 zf-HC2 domain-containing protein [Sphaerochaeta sp.]
MCVDDELLNTYLDGELQEPWRTQVQEHLGYCNACRQRLEQLRALHQKVADAVLPDSEISARQDRVLQYFEKTRFSSSNKKMHIFRKKIQVRLVPALITSAAAFVVVFIGAFVLFGNSSQQGQEILPGVASQIDSAHIQQVTEVQQPSLDMFSLEQIVQHLDAMGYAVKLEVKAVTPLE